MSVWSGFFQLCRIWPESLFSFWAPSGLDYKAEIETESVKFGVRNVEMLWKTRGKST